jgi:hypothetical protein
MIWYSTYSLPWDVLPVATHGHLTSNQYKEKRKMPVRIYIKIIKWSAVGISLTVFALKKIFMQICTWLIIFCCSDYCSPLVHYLYTYMDLIGKLTSLYSGPASTTAPLRGNDGDRFEGCHGSLPDCCYRSSSSRLSVQYPSTRRQLRCTGVSIYDL